MRKRAWLIILGAIAVVALALWLAWPTPESSYNSHTLSYWLDKYGENSGRLYGEAYTAHVQAGEAISHFDTNALPLLLKRLRYHPGRLRQATSRLLPRIPKQLQPKWLTKWASPEKVNLQPLVAADAISILGPIARPALPALTNMMYMNNPSDSHAPYVTMRALAGVGKDAIPFLLAFLQDTNAPNHADAISCIGRYAAFRTNAAPAIPTLIGCLGDKDAAVRTAATNALREIAPGLLTNAPPP